MNTPRHTITRVTRSEAETERFAADFAAALHPGDVVALHGQLGAGKTRFVRGLAAGLGIDPAQVSSPTYVLMQEYEGAPGTPPIIHIDAYRLPPGDDLSSLGLDAASLADAILVVEWAERIAHGGALPDERFEITIEHGVGDKRIIAAIAPDGRTIDAAPREPFQCRACGRAIDPGSAHFPFCSDRCRMSDLNRWFTGEYRISREIKDTDLDAMD